MGEVGRETALAQRDAVAKTIYARMFDQIVGIINGKLKKRRRSSMKGSQAKDATIGLLDIFGFEDMAINGFEQMFINLTNERIQHLFNSIMFDREVKLYESEGISPPFHFDTGNIECVKLFTSPSKPPGIVKLLGESTIMKNGRDGAAFVSVLNSSFSSHRCYKVADPQDVQRNVKVKGLKLGGSNRLDYRDCFQIKHFAGTVMYTVKEWVPKSMDALLPHLAEVLLNSTKSYIQELFDQEIAGKLTVGEKFVKQLEGLAHTLEEGETLFVRCIKSNPQKQPGAVNRPLVLEQLLFGGVISALEMRHRGMPERMDYEDFCDKFESIEEPKNRKRDYRVRTELLLRDVFGLEAEAQHEYAFGYTKVFMQSTVFSFLRSLDALRFKHLALKVQQRWLVYLGVLRIRKVEKAGRALKAAQEKAAVDRVEKLPGFVKLMAAAKAKIGPAERALAEARRKHGQDAQKISAALPQTDLFKVIQDMEIHLEKIAQRRSVAVELFGMNITRCVDSALQLLDRVTAVKDQFTEAGAEVGSEDLATAETQWKEVCDSLEKFRKTDAPALKLEGPLGIDLEGDTDLMAIEGGICPKATKILQFATEQVVKLETMAHEVLNVKLKFRKSVLAFHSREEVLRARLEQLQESVRSCLSEDDSVVQLIKTAWSHEDKCQNLMKAGDAEGYRVAVTTLEAATADAESQVKNATSALARTSVVGRDVRTTVVDASDPEREALKLQIDLTQRQLDSARLKFTEHMDSLQREIDGVRESPSEVHTLRERVTTVSKRVEKFSAELDKRVRDEEVNRHDDVFRNLSMFDKLHAALTPMDNLLDARSFIEEMGMGDFAQQLLDVHEAIESLQEAGASRVNVNRCISHFMKLSYGGRGPAAASSTS